MTRAPLQALASTFATLALGIGSFGCASPAPPVQFEGIDQPRYTRCMLKPSEDRLYTANYVDAVGGIRPGTEAKIILFSADQVSLNLGGRQYTLFPAADRINTGSIPAFLEKYFVDTPARLGLDRNGNPFAPEAAAGAAANPFADNEAAPTPAPAGNPLADDEAAQVGPGFRVDRWEPEVWTGVQNGVAHMGMTKEQVYVALGPPLLINFDQVATNLPLAQILEANRWVYYGARAQRNVTFGLGGKRVYTFSEGKLFSVEK